MQARKFPQQDQNSSENTLISENTKELNTLSFLDAINSVVLNLSTLQNYDYLKVF
jgi:hypothetical protein